MNCELSIFEKGYLVVAIVLLLLMLLQLYRLGNKLHKQLEQKEKRIRELEIELKKIAG